MIGFLCATPYHVLLAVNLTVCESLQNADIFLLNHFPDAKRLASALSKIGLFRKVQLIDENVLTSFHKIKRFYHAFVPCKVVRQMVSEFNYSRFIFFAIDFLNASYIITKSRNSCDFFYGEDGIGSYMNDRLYVPKAVSETLLRITKRQHELDRIRKIYLFRPKLQIANRQFHPIGMPSIDFSDKRIKEALDILWKVEPERLKSKEVIYFEEPLSEILKTDVSGFEKEVKSVLYRFYPNKKVFIKKHPRMFSEPDENTMQCDAPFERIMEFFNPDKTVLVSVMCTAALNFVLMAKRETSVVFLYKAVLGENHRLSNKLDSFIKHIEENGECKARFFTPENTDEFLGVMRSLGENNES